MHLNPNVGLDKYQAVPKELVQTLEGLLSDISLEELLINCPRILATPTMPEEWSPELVILSMKANDFLLFLRNLTSQVCGLALAVSASDGYSFY